MKHRSAAIIGTLGVMSLAVVGCSSTSSSSSPSPSATTTMSTEQFCSEVKKFEAELKSIGSDLSSGNPATQALAIGKLTNFYNNALSQLPANQSAAISQALQDAKSKVGTGGNASSAQDGINKVNEAVKKQCPTL